MSEVVFLIGCGGHARSVADVLVSNCPEVRVVFVDENAHDGERILGFETMKGLPPDAGAYHVALGDSKLRERFFSKSCISIVSSDSYISRSAYLGVGVFVGHSAHIGPEARLGDGCIANTRCIIEHEVRIGSYCHLSVNSTLLGRVTIGSHVFVGAGAVIRDGIQICSNVMIGAGAVVVKDIAIPGTYVGNPARLLSGRSGS